MVSKFALFNSLLLASTALAVPSSRLEDRLARRRENRQSKPINRAESHAGAVSNVDYSSNWAGAVLEKDYGTFTGVSGTFTAPTLSGSDGSASAWVGVDGYTPCGTAILQTGIDFTINNGSVSYDPWYEWYPDYSYYFSNFSITAGDVITTSVTAWNTTSGRAVIHNLSTGQTVQQDVTSSHALCEQNAEWIVEDFESDSLVPFADFGTVTFTNATATDFNGTTYTPTGAAIVDMEQNNQVLTSVSISRDSVTIQYI